MCRSTRLTIDRSRASPPQTSRWLNLTCGAIIDLTADASAQGNVTVPFQKQFWGDYYGNFTDQFDVQWAINCPAEE